MITDKVKTFEDACQIVGVDPKKLPDVSMLPKKDQKSMVAYYMLIIIARALNEGWEPDWSDQSQWKYWAWFEIKATKAKPAGVGFSFSGYDLWRSRTVVGSRLCFKSSELALYAGKQFEKEYKDYILLT